MGQKHHVQFILSQEEYDNLVSINNSFTVPVGINILCRHVVRKWLDHQRRRAAQGTGINHAESSAV